MLALKLLQLLLLSEQQLVPQPLLFDETVL
jgi:hypothetical protein